jgi:hypothetical protein
MPHYAVVTTDGEPLGVEIGPGETYVIEPGHQAEVIGSEAFVGFEFQPEAAEAYARPW